MKNCKKCNKIIPKGRKYCSKECFNTRNEIIKIEDTIDNEIVELFNIRVSEPHHKELALKVYKERIDSKALINLNDDVAVNTMFVRLRKFFKQ